MSSLGEYFNLIKLEVTKRGLEPANYNVVETEQAIADWGYYCVTGCEPLDALKTEYPSTNWGFVIK